MALLTVQHTTAGLNPAWAAASAAGDTYPNTGKETINLRNEGPNPLTVYVTAQHACNQSVLHTIAFIVPAQVGTIPTVVLLGPEAFQFYNDNDGRADLTYSSPVQTPPGAPDLALVYSGSLANLGIGGFRYMVTFVNASGETTGGTEVQITTLSGFQAVTLNGIPIGPAGTTKRGIYRTPRNGASGSEQLVRYVTDNTTTSFTDAIADVFLGAAVPTANTAGVPAPGAAAVAAGAAGNPNGTYDCQVTFVNAQGETLGGALVTIVVSGTQINWSSVPIGPAGTTARKLYRGPKTVGEGATLTEKVTVSTGTTNTSTDTPSTPLTEGGPGNGRLVTTLSDNTTTTFTDNLTDAALAAAAQIPTTSTANVLQIAVTSA